MRLYEKLIYLFLGVIFFAYLTLTLTLFSNELQCDEIIERKYPSGGSVNGLTKRQRQIVDYIRCYIAEHNYSPSYREIMRDFQFTSLGSVYKHIEVLKRKGALVAEKAAARSLHLSEEEQRSAISVELPFFGQILAGYPIETFPQVDTVTVPGSMVPHPERSYVLEVKGDSMIEEGIREGDLVIVEADSQLAAGVTVVALLHGSEATLKRYYLRGEYIYLEPANPAYSTLIIRAEEVAIQGVVRGLVRIGSYRG